MVVAATHRYEMTHEKARNIMDYFESRKVSVVLKNSDNFHMVITGATRVVNFYPSTGTVSCNRKKDLKLKPITIRNMKHETALMRVVDIAEHGY